jgi:hypothetical protein
MIDLIIVEGMRSKRVRMIITISLRVTEWLIQFPARCVIDCSVDIINEF